MIEDPTAVPESAAAASEYVDAAHTALFAESDPARAKVLAHSASESEVAESATRARAYLLLGTILEQEGATDDAIDAYRRADAYGDPQGRVDADRLLAGEQTGAVEAARHPVNEAEADRYYETGKKAFENGDLERAYDVFLALHGAGINNAGQQGQAAYYLGVILKAQGGHDAAYQYFQQASEIGGTDIRPAAMERLAEYSAQDDNADAGRDVAAGTELADADAVATMLTAAVDRYTNNDTAGASARFTAVHSADAATTEQRGYAAYYLGVLAWNGGDYDVARTHFREARSHADSHTADLASQMLRSHWQE